MRVIFTTHAHRRDGCDMGVFGRSKPPIVERVALVIDDRLEVLSHLVNTVPHLYLFRSRASDVDRFRRFLPHVYPISRWSELVDAMLGRQWTTFLHQNRQPGTFPNTGKVDEFGFGSASLTSEMLHALVTIGNRIERFVNP